MPEGTETKPTSCLPWWQIFLQQIY